MQVGILAEPVKRRSGDRRPLAELYRETLDTVAWLEDIGLDFVLFGEHHFMDHQWNPSPLALLAAAAARTSRIGLGTNVLLTPLYNDIIRLAEDIATVDLISNGRSIIIFGTGSTKHEFNTFGVDPAERHGRMFEVMSFVRRCFDGPQSFDHEGRYYTVHDMRLTTQPVQRPFPIYYGGFGPQNSRRAGRSGYHCASGLAEEWEEGIAEAGLNPSDFNTLAMGGGGIVAATETEVETLRQDLDRYARLTYQEYMIDPGTRRDVAFGQLIENPPPFEASGFAGSPMSGFIGTPDQVIEQNQVRFAQTTATHLIGGVPGTHIFSWLNDHRENFELYMREVVPELRKLGRDPVRPTERGDGPIIR